MFAAGSWEDFAFQYCSGLALGKLVAWRHASVLLLGRFC